MKYIPGWQNMALTCEFCGETRSVKYQSQDDGRHYCNKCALTFESPALKRKKVLQGDIEV